VVIGEQRIPAHPSAYDLGAGGVDGEAANQSPAAGANRGCEGRAGEESTARAALNTPSNNGADATARMEARR